MKQKIKFNLNNWVEENEIDRDLDMDIDNYFDEVENLNNNSNFEINDYKNNLKNEVEFPIINDLNDVILNIFNQNKNILRDYESLRSVIDNYNQFKQKNYDLEELKKDILIKIDDFYTKSNEIMNIKFNLNDLINEINNINRFLIKNSKKEEILEKILEFKIDLKNFESNISYIFSLYNDCKDSLKFLNLRQNYNNFKKYKNYWEEILNNLLELIKNYLFHKFQITWNNVSFDRYDTILDNFSKNKPFIQDIDNSLFQTNDVNQLLNFLKIEKNENPQIMKIHQFLFNWYFHLINDKIQFFLKKILNNQDLDLNQILNQFILLNIIWYLEGLHFYTKDDYNYINEIISKIKDNFNKYVKYEILKRLNRQDISIFYKQVMNLKTAKNINNINFIIEINNKFKINEKFINYFNHLNDMLINIIYNKFEEILIKVLNQEYYTINTKNIKISSKSEFTLNLDDYDNRIFELTKYIVNIINDIFFGNKRDNFIFLIILNYIKNIINTEKYFKNINIYYIWAFKFTKNVFDLLSLKVDNLNLEKLNENNLIKDVKSKMNNFKIDQVENEVKLILYYFLNKINISNIDENSKKEVINTLI